MRSLVFQATHLRVLFWLSRNSSTLRWRSLRSLPRTSSRIRNRQLTKLILQRRRLIASGGCESCRRIYSRCKNMQQMPDVTRTKSFPGVPPPTDLSRRIFQVPDPINFLWALRRTLMHITGHPPSWKSITTRLSLREKIPSWLNYSQNSIRNSYRVSQSGLICTDNIGF